jgi:hypothetical protein
MKKVKKPVKIVKDNNGNPLIRNLGWLIIIFIVLALLFKSDSKLSPVKDTKTLQSSTQLIGPNGELDGFGTALKTTGKNGFELNVTIFLEDPPNDKNYYVMLTQGGDGFGDLLAGKMSKSGDVYSLNYTSSSDKYVYGDLVVISASETEIQEGTGAVVLTGTFSE